MVKVHTTVGQEARGEEDTWTRISTSLPTTWSLRDTCGLIGGGEIWTRISMSIDNIQGNLCSLLEVIGETDFKLGSMPPLGI